MHIPCIVDSTRFRPVDRHTARAALGFYLDTAVIGLGSAYATSGDFDLKGGHLLNPALEALRKRYSGKKIALLVFGPVTRGFIEKAGVPVFPAGFISSEPMLNLLYNCCDVFLCPSIVESFGLTVLEAAFAGVPSVAFRATGVQELVEHGVTGFLAEPYEARSLAEGLQWCLENPKAGAAAREMAERDFDMEDIVKAHLEYYSETIGRSGS